MIVMGVYSVQEKILLHVPGIVTQVRERARIRTHGYEGHNLWHTVYHKIQLNLLG
jgi:hypothetical protein